MPSLDFIPYARQSIDEDDIAAVVKVLRSDWLTTGPKIGEFEASVARFCGVEQGVAVSSGTAGLHVAMAAAGIGAGDEVILPSLTFAATANAILYQGAKPVFAEVDPQTLLLDPEHVARLVTKKTKAIVAVDYAGLPCDYQALRRITEAYGLKLIADACHSVGARQGEHCVGQLADLTVLSFHPAKHITTGEGGMVLTRDAQLATNMRRFRNHGISTDHRQRAEAGTFHYEMVELGFNYRINDFQCALGISQLGKLPLWLEARRRIAAQYMAAFAKDPLVEIQASSPGSTHAYHLFVVQLPFAELSVTREQANLRLRELGIGVNVHYPCLHLHPYYRERMGYKPGDLPVTEAVQKRILSLPMYATLTEGEVNRVVEGLRLALKRDG